MTRPVSLAMYEPGGAANAALWDGLRAYLAADGVEDLPEDLTLPADYETTWLDPASAAQPDLWLSATAQARAPSALCRNAGLCVEGTDGAYYKSAIVVRADDPAEALQELRGNERPITA